MLHAFSFSLDFEKDSVLIPVDLASPAESLRSIPSFDDEPFLLIPMLMGIYNSIFISINIFGMHQSFSRVGLLGQLIAVRKTSVAPSLAPSVGKGRSTLGGSSLGPGRAGPFRSRPVHLCHVSDERPLRCWDSRSLASC